MASSSVGLHDPPDWRHAPFAVHFMEKGQSIKWTTVGTAISYPDFISVLHDVTTEDAHKLPDLPVSLEVNEGLSLRDGPWWYRVVDHGQLTKGFWEPDGGQQYTITPPIPGDWKVLGSFHDFLSLRRIFFYTRKPIGSWIEFQHQLQKDRDEKHVTSTSFKRNGPVIVDGSKAPPPELILPMLQFNTPALVEQTNSSAATLPKKFTLTQKKPRKNGDTNVAGRLVKFPKTGIFPLPKPRRITNGPVHSHQEFIRTQSFMTKSHDSKSVRDMESRNTSFMSNPYPTDPPVERSELCDDGPGPTVPSSPTRFPPLDLGRPVAPFGLANFAWRPPQPPVANYCPAATVYPFNKITMNGADGEPRGLDPALEANQSVTWDMSRRSMIPNMSYEQSGGRLKLVDMKRRSSSLEKRVAEPDTAMQDDVSSTNVEETLAKASRKGSHQQGKRKTTQRENQKIQVGDEGVSKERGRVKETLDRQRTERQKRAERRESLKG